MRKIFSVLTAVAMSMAITLSAVNPSARKSVLPKAPEMVSVKPDAKRITARDAMTTKKVAYQSPAEKAIKSVGNRVLSPLKKQAKAPMQRVLGGANLVACGVYSAVLSDDELGLVTIPECETLVGGISVNAGTIVGDKYYGTYLYTYGSWILGAYIYVIDTADWTVLSTIEADLDVMARCMATDPVSNLIYGVFYNEDASGYELATVDPSTMTRMSTICTLSDILPMSVSFDSAGTLYAIDPAGDLYTVNKTTGEMTAVAATGLSTHYLTSGAIDPKTDIYYYATSNDADVLYTIDLKNGYAVSEYGEIDVEAEGMVVAPPAAEPGAPGEVEDVNVEFSEGALTGTITFTLPSTTFGGEALTGEVSYVVTLDGAPSVIGVDEAGAVVTEEVEVEKAGMYEFCVYALNDVGKGPKTQPFKLWVGPDAPKAPENVTASYENGVLSVAWDAVEESVHGGYFDATGVVYNVTRIVNGEETTVAVNLSTCSYSEEMAAPTTLTVISFEVTASFDGTESSAAASNALSLGSIVPPYTQTFDDADSTAGYTVIDGNGDDTVWKWSSGRMRIGYNGSEDMDDWLITPGVELEGGKYYTFSVAAAAMSAAYPERLEVKMGGAATAEAMTVAVINPTDITSTDNMVLSAVVTVAEDGIYYFGIHGISYADKYYLYVDDVTISAPFDAQAPNVVTDVKFGAQYDGSSALDISFKAPAVNFLDEALTSLEKVEVERDGVLVMTFENPTPGQELSFKDEAEEGDYLYTFTAYNASGAGKPYSEGAHMGMLLAAAPVDVVATESYSTEGYVTISWTPVAKDINGNDIDPELITYAIYDIDSQLVVGGITSDNPEYSYQAVEAGTPQEFLYWFIVPVDDAGANMTAGGYGVTDMIPVGTPYTMPMNESVAGGKLSNIWGYSGEGAWGLASESEAPVCSPQDQDGGMIYYNPKETGAESTFFSGKVVVDEAEGVAFSFYYFPTDDADYEFMPVAMVAGYTYDLLDEWMSSKKADGADADWTRVIVPLVDYCGATIQVGIKARCLSYSSLFCVDNLSAANMVDYDLAISDFNAPRTLKVGTEGLITVTVSNFGQKPVENFTIDLLKDGEVVETAEQTGLASGKSVTVTFAQTPDLFWDNEVTYQARINYEGDENPENNSSINLTVIIAPSMLPAVEDLEAKWDGNNVALTWTDPDTSAAVEEVVEDAESYESFAINDAGDWTFIDNDKSSTYGFSGISFEGSGQPMAFMVFDASVNDNLLQSGMTHSGNKVFACFAATNAPNNDWMISPELCGEAQTVSFFARAWMTDYGMEEFMFYYSTTGADPEDMILVAETHDVGDSWTEYSYDIPEGAKYFAIRCVSNDRFIFLVDDITFKVGAPELELTGYDIYRDGELIASGVGETTYVDENVDKTAEHTYHVVAVYTIGESALSNPATPESVGIDAIVADDNDDAIYYNIQGIKVNKPASGSVVIKVEGNKARKVLVK